MAQLLIGDITSRMRGLIKADNQDSFITDRYLYSIWRKYADMLVKEMDQKGKLLPFSSVFETLDYVALEEVDKVEAAACIGVKSYATFRKTKLAMPMFREGAYGPMVRSITSLDGSISLTMTTLDAWVILSKSKNFRFNKEKYAWYLNDRLYFPNIDWPAVRIEGIFEDDISAFKCDYEDKCKIRQEQSLNVPDYMVARIEQMAMAEILGRLQIPTDIVEDNINLNR